MNTTPTRHLTRLIRAFVPAVLLGLAFQASAQAQVIYTDVTDTTLTTAGNLYIDLGKNGAPGSISTTSFANADILVNVDASWAGWFGLTVNVSGLNGSTILMGNSAALDAPLHAAKLASGTVISTTGSSGANMRYALDSAKGEWGDYTNQAQPGYLAISFDDNADTYFGWIQMSLDRNQVTVYDFAYEAVAEASIMAGSTAAAIPEPSTYAAMAGALALGIAMWRRSKGVRPQAA